MYTTKILSNVMIGLLLTATAAPAAAPPGLLNYQGVLRDASDRPLDGSYNMVFRLFDAGSDGTLLIRDQHEEGGSGPVTVTGGLFSVEIGSGVLIDDSGLYTSISEVVRDFSDLWVEVSVATPGLPPETLAPRVRLVSSPYALNAASVEAGAITDGDVTLSTGDVTLISGTFSGDGSGLTSVTASDLVGGNYQNIYSFSNPSNIFVGSGSALTGVTASTLGAGVHGNAYSFSNPGNSFTGDGSGLTSLDAGNLASGTLGDARLAGTYSGALTLSNAANVYDGDGSDLTLNASNLLLGTVPDGRLSGTYSGAVTFSNALNNFSGDGSGLTSITASDLAAGTYTSAVNFSNALNNFSGDGSGLTSLSAANLTGILPGLDAAALTSLNASELSSGTLPNARLDSGTVTLRGNTFNGANQLVQLDGTGALPALDGTNLTGLTVNNTDTLDGLDSLQFLRADVADTASGVITFDALPTAITVDGGSIYINPASAVADQTLLGVAVAGTEKLRLDEDGDLSVAGDLSVTGTLSGDGSGLTTLGAGNLTGILPGLDASALTSLNASELSSGTLPNARLDSGTVTLRGNTFNGANQLVQLDGSGNLTALNGSALTDLDASALASGTVADARLSSNATLQGNTFNGASQLVQLDGSSALPAVDGSALTGVDADTLDSLASTDFLRSNASDDYTAGTLTIEGPASLDVNGSLLLAQEMFMNHDGPDADVNIYFYDFGLMNGQNLKWDDIDARFEFSSAVGIQGVIAVGSPIPAALGVSQYNQIGMSSSGPNSDDINKEDDVSVAGDVEIDETLYLSTELYMEGHTSGGQDTDQTIYFYNNNMRNRNFYQWDEETPIYLQDDGIESAFVSHIGGGTQNGWSWDSDSDSVMCLDESGNLQTDGTQTANSGCDLAETFIGSEGLEGGTVVVIDPLVREGVVMSSRPLDGTVVGVVSGNAGMVLSGPTADFLPHARELAQVVEALRRDPQNPGLLAAREELDTMKEHWTRGNVPVALVGRVPVKVDGTFGPVALGDRLTTGETPGHAVVLEGSGPYFGIALEAFQGERGTVLTLLQQGWYAAPVEIGVTAGAASDAQGTPPRAVQIADVQTMDSNLHIVLDRGADEVARLSVFSNGEQGLEAEVLRVDEQGNLYTRGSVRPASMDLAEYFAVTEPVEPGDVLVAERKTPGRFGRGSIASDPAVIGVVSAEPGVLLGSGISRIAAADPGLALELERARAAGDNEEEARLWSRLESRFRQTHAPVALSGTVPCKVDAGYGAINIGDLLTTSPTRGHAMRASDAAPGTIIGKALEPLDAGTGVVRMLVMMR